MVSQEEQFIYACESNDLKLAKSLIEGGVNIEYQNRDKYTGFICTCKENNMNIIKLLIENKVNINQQNRNGDTGFMFACLPV